MESQQDIDQLIKRNFSKLLDLANNQPYRGCLFDPICRSHPIKAHSVSRAILSKIQVDGHVLRPSSHLTLSPTGTPKSTLSFRAEGITQASRGTFACKPHDEMFKAIDTTPIDPRDHRVLNLMFYRAILKETWVLLSTLSLQDEVEKEIELPTPITDRPNVRLTAMLDSIAAIKPFIDDPHRFPDSSPIDHIVRRIRTTRPIIAASAAGASLDIVFEENTRRILSITETQSLTRKNPNNTWAITVIPQNKEHTLVISWIKDNEGDQYFSHFRKLNGQELEEAVSAELIVFCENWFLHPKVWKSFSRSKQNAILSSYDNTDQLIEGSYQWHGKKQNTKWYEAIGIPNKHQINLFKYDESIFK